MRLLFVLAHPRSDSLTASLCQAALTAARQRGHETRLIDLHAESFDPVLRQEEHLGYDDPTAVPADLQAHLDALQWAQGVFLVFPTWWSGPPAILKGWLDRVWRPGHAFEVRDGAMRPGLTRIGLLGVITTLGTPWWAWTFLLGAPGRKALLRGLRPCIGWRARTIWLALHGIDSTTETARARFVQRVKARIARIPL